MISTIFYLHFSTHVDFHFICQLKIYIPYNLQHMQFYAFSLSSMQYCSKYTYSHTIPYHLCFNPLCLFHLTFPVTSPWCRRAGGCVWGRSRRILCITSSLWLPRTDQPEACTGRHPPIRSQGAQILCSESLPSPARPSLCANSVQKENCIKVHGKQQLLKCVTIT